MNVRVAAAQIDSIWNHLARNQCFHGYRPLTVALTGVLGGVAALGQPIIVPNPRHDVDRYVLVWTGVAIVSALLTGAELLWAYTQLTSEFQRRLTRQAVRQFAPCLCVGATITWAISTFWWDCIGLLPGLWALCFSLGIFSSLPFMSPRVFWVAMYYLLVGMICLSIAHTRVALHPLGMGITFGGGQLLLACVLCAAEGSTHGEA